MAKAAFYKILIALFPLLAAACTSIGKKDEMRNLASAQSFQQTWRCKPRTRADAQGEYLQFIFNIQGSQIKGQAFTPLFGHAGSPVVNGRLSEWGELSGSHSGWTWKLSPLEVKNGIYYFSLDVQLIMDDDEDFVRFRLDPVKGDLLVQDKFSSDDKQTSSEGHYECQLQ